MPCAYENQRLLVADGWEPFRCHEAHGPHQTWSPARRHTGRQEISGGKTSNSKEWCPLPCRVTCPSSRNGGLHKTLMRFIYLFPYLTLNAINAIAPTSTD